MGKPLLYQKLGTEFYDLTKPEAGPKEVAFYERLLKENSGPFLEAMCGSGRVLVPLCKKGWVIDGVDNSDPMLESCRQRCKESGIAPQLYRQSLESLSLPQKYGLIFITIASFQLFRDRAEAMQVLKNLHQHLLPGGKLAIETFVPWDWIRDGIAGEVLGEQSSFIAREKKARSSDGFEIVNKSEVSLDFKEQLEVSRTRYEKWAEGKLLHAEEEEYSVRWYHRYEMAMFLEKAGFSSVQILDTSFEHNPQAVVYVASFI